MLFNLYAFDRLRSTNSKPPALELVSCTFKFFVNQLDALILVETNNMGFVSAGDELNSDRYIAYFGEDRGA